MNNPDPYLKYLQELLKREQQTGRTLTYEEKELIFFTFFPTKPNPPHHNLITYNPIHFSHPQ